MFKAILILYCRPSKKDSPRPKSNPRRADSSSLSGGRHIPHSFFHQLSLLQLGPFLSLSLFLWRVVVQKLPLSLLLFLQDFRIRQPALNPIRPPPFPASYRAPRRFVLLASSHSPSHHLSLALHRFAIPPLGRIFRSTPTLNRVSLSLYLLNFHPSIVFFAPRDAFRRKTRSLSRTAQQISSLPQPTTTDPTIDCPSKKSTLPSFYTSFLLLRQHVTPIRALMRRATAAAHHCQSLTLNSSPIRRRSPLGQRPAGDLSRIAIASQRVPSALAATLETIAPAESSSCSVDANFRPVAEPGNAIDATTNTTAATTTAHPRC